MRFHPPRSRKRRYASPATFGCAFLAQALAFNSLFALFPLAVLVLSASTFVIPDSERRLLAFFHAFTPTLNDYITANLKSYIYGRGISSVIALGRFSYGRAKISSWAWLTRSTARSACRRVGRSCMAFCSRS